MAGPTSSIVSAIRSRCAAALAPQRSSVFNSSSCAFASSNASLLRPSILHIPATSQLATVAAVSGTPIHHSVGSSGPSQRNNGRSGGRLCPPCHRRLSQIACKEVEIMRVGLYARALRRIAPKTQKCNSANFGGNASGGDGRFRVSTSILESAARKSATPNLTGPWPIRRGGSSMP